MTVNVRAVRAQHAEDDLPVPVDTARGVTRRHVCNGRAAGSGGATTGGAASSLPYRRHEAAALTDVPRTLVVVQAQLSHVATAGGGSD